MSSIEERLARDIAAITGGVIVTESDLRDARESVDQRIDSRLQQGRRRIVIAAAAAAVLIPVAGFAAFQTLGSDDKSAPQPADPAPTSPDPNDAFLTGSEPTPELLQGVWRVDNGTELLRFTADGSIQIDDGGHLYADPRATGTYEIDGDVITVSVDGGPDGCAGQTFAMRASLTGPGAMRVAHTRPGTGNCAPERVPVTDSPGSHADVWWALEQVLPTSEALTGFVFSAEPGWQPVPDESTLYGVWVAELGGHVLEIDPGGGYVVADDSGDVVDRGQWSLQASELTLASSADSDACSEGDRLVLGGVEELPGHSFGLRGTLQQNACGGAWTPDAWILLPHEVG
jgi:hypothetical protein